MARRLVRQPFVWIAATALVALTVTGQTWPEMYGHLDYAFRYAFWCVKMLVWHVSGVWLS